jgi:nuclear pore complex protein Nup62
MNSTTPAGAPPPDAQKKDEAKPAAGGLFGQAAAAPKAGGLFGGLGGTPSAAATPPAAAPSGGLFGNVKPAATESTTPAPPAAAAAASATPLFGGAASAQPKAAGSLFGAKPAAPAAEAPKTAGGLFGGGSAATPTAAADAPSGILGSKPAAATAAAETPKTAGGLFGGAAAGASSSAATPITTATAAASKPAGGLFGGATPAAAPTAAANTTTPAPTSILGGAKPAATPAAQNATALGASTTGPTSQLARLKNKTMDEIITRWATDLSKYQKEFKEQAAQVAAWDRLLVENGAKIQELYLNTYEAEKASRDVERHLITVESQQEELEAWLDKYETEVDQMFSRDIGRADSLGGPDQEREKTYKLAEKLTDRLDEMGRDLTKMIKEINDISGTLSKGNKPDDPVGSFISRFLAGKMTNVLRTAEPDCPRPQQPPQPAPVDRQQCGRPAGQGERSPEGQRRHWQPVRRLGAGCCRELLPLLHGRSEMMASLEAGKG